MRTNCAKCNTGYQYFLPVIKYPDGTAAVFFQWQIAYCDKCNPGKKIKS